MCTTKEGMRTAPLHRSLCLPDTCLQDGPLVQGGLPKKDQLVMEQPQGKTEWPELVGRDTEEAKMVIEQYGFHVVLVKLGQVMTMDFRQSRVRVSCPFKLLPPGVLPVYQMPLWMRQVLQSLLTAAAWQVVHDNDNKVVKPPRVG